MTATYLYQPGSAVIAVDGTAIIKVRPDTAQYWLPTLVRVGVRSGTPLKAELHHGSMAALTDSTTIKDSTLSGQNNTSSILTGTIVWPGEGIAVLFANGTPGDVATVEVIGLSSDVPPTAGLIPTSPGLRFVTDNHDQLSVATVPLTNIAAHTSQQIAAFDVRGFESFGLLLRAVTHAPITGFNGVRIQSLWTPTASPFSAPIYETVDEIFAGGGGAFPADFDTFILQDSVHGPFLQLRISALNNDSIDVTGVFTGNTRSLDRRYIANVGSIFASGATEDRESGVLLDVQVNINAGLTQSFVCPMGPGAVGIRQATVGQAGAFFLFTPSGRTALAIGRAVNFDQLFTWELPHTALLAQIQNTGAGVGTYIFNVVSSRDNW